MLEADASTQEDLKIRVMKGAEVILTTSVDADADFVGPSQRGFANRFMSKGKYFIIAESSNTAMSHK